MIYNIAILSEKRNALADKHDDTSCGSTHGNTGNGAGKPRKETEELEIREYL